MQHSVAHRKVIIAPNTLQSGHENVKNILHQAFPTVLHQAADGASVCGEQSS